MKTLVIDGYNAIHKVPRLRKLADKSLKEAREEITRIAKEYKRKYGGISGVHVVFDGRDEYRKYDIPKPPEHIFSASGQGDRTLIRLIRQLGRQYHVLVVSDDNYVRNNARAHNASILTVSEFFSFTSKKRPSGKKSSSEKISHKDALKINEELKRRWNLY
jgi:predicted RNA-binding protein with PIN domain